MNSTICEICGLPAIRVMEGGNYCGEHDHYTSRVAASPCAVCGAPATRIIAGRDLCDVRCEYGEPIRRAA